MKIILSLQLKLLIVVSLVVIATLSFFGFVSISNQENIFNNAFHDSATTLANALDSNISSLADLTEIEKLQSNIYKLVWLNSNIIGINISLPTETGLTVVASNNTSEIGSKAPPAGVNSLQDGSITLDKVIEPDKTTVLRVITPVHVGGKRVGVYTILMSLDTFEQSITQTKNEFIFIIIISILILIVLLWLFIKMSMINPIEELLHGMEQIGMGTMQYRVKTNKKDEIGSLFSGLNNMTQKLEDKTDELNRSKYNIEMIIDNLADGLIEYSADGKIKRINDMAEKLLGIKRYSVIGHKLMPENDSKKEFFAISNIVLHNKEDQTWEMQIEFPLPTSLQIVTTKLPAVLGPDAGYVSIIRDITREKIIDEEKSSFISVAAHQMRTPLSTIKFMLESLFEGHKEELSPEVKELLNIGTSTTTRMIGLVNDLLSVSRIEEGRYGYAYSKNNLCELVENVAKEYTIALAKKSQTFSVVCSPAVPPFVFDSVKLSIAVHNLIDNAINYTPVGGNISVALSLENDRAVLKVSDTGIGIPQESKEKLFTKFFRAGNAILFSPNGSGLGLYIVKNIIMQHGGEMEVTSNTPTGTVFTIKLPVINTLKS